MSEITLLCDCGCEIVRVTTFDWDSGPWTDIELGWYFYGGLGGEPFWQRVRRAWDLLCGRDVCKASLVLTRVEAARLAAWLVEVGGA